jgi:hypothetical protein
MKLFSKSDALAQLQVIDAEGAMCVPGCLEEEERHALLDELKTYTLVRQPPELGPYKVKQDFASLETFPAGSCFLALRNDLEVQLQWLFGAALSNPLKFNDLVVQTYEPGSQGISPHRDGLSRINLVALVVLEGKGRFGLCDNRAGENPRPIRNEPGDLLIMRAPGFLGSDVRPFHFVDRVEERRTTFALRHKIKEGSI